MTKYVPNVLTLGRIVLVPPIIILLLFPGKFTSALAAFIFVLASVTDFFDGFMARKFGVESSFGKLMDPIADKVLVTSALIMLIALDRVAAWIVAIIISREVAVSALRAVSKNWDTTLSPSPIGKIKAVTQFVAIVPLMIHYKYKLFVTVDFHLVGTAMIYLALALTVWSGVDYFYKFYKEYETR
jgi:CDP-diacylglycerol--glycerol-3-phosphate 3-phosphatidyltransferase